MRTPPQVEAKRIAARATWLRKLAVLLRKAAQAVAEVEAGEASAMREASGATEGVPLDRRIGAALNRGHAKVNEMLVSWDADRTGMISPIQLREKLGGLGVEIASSAELEAFYEQLESETSSKPLQVKLAVRIVASCMLRLHPHSMCSCSRTQRRRLRTCSGSSAFRDGNESGGTAQGRRGHSQAILRDCSEVAPRGAWSLDMCTRRAAKGHA